MKPKKIQINGERTSDKERLFDKWEGKFPLFSDKQIKQAILYEKSVILADICLYGEFERRCDKKAKKEFEKILLEGVE